MGEALEIGDDMTAEALRRAARAETDGRATARTYAIAGALDGLSRAEAARLAGMERQALRDAVLRTNAEGLAGLRDRPKGRPKRRLSAAQEAEFAEACLARPRSGGGRGLRLDAGRSLRADLCGWLAAHHGKTYHPSSMTRVLRRMGFSRETGAACPCPGRDLEAQERFEKGGSPRG